MLRKESARDIGFGLLSGAIALTLIIESMSDKPTVEMQDLGFNSLFFPQILLFIWMALSVLTVIKGMRSRARDHIVLTDDVTKAVMALVLVAIYVLLMSAIGFLFSSILFAVSFMWLFGYRHPIPALSTAIIFPLVVWYVFTYTLSVLLPVSPWFPII